MGGTRIWLCPCLWKIKKYKWLTRNKITKETKTKIGRCTAEPPEKETKDTVDEIKLKKEDKTVRRAKKKNLVIMRRPPLIYHPPPEIYHKPNVIVHRPDIVIHRPSVVFHQPSVVVHRPPVIYHQPPVIFHQPAPMVHQPIIHAHDRYFAPPPLRPVYVALTSRRQLRGCPTFLSRRMELWRAL